MIVSYHVNKIQWLEILCIILRKYKFSTVNNILQFMIKSKYTPSASLSWMQNNKIMFW